MIGISWPDLTFRPVNLWTVTAAWKLSKPPISGCAPEAGNPPRVKTEHHAARMIATISQWR